MKKLLMTLGLLTSFSAMASVTPIAQCGETNGYSFLPNYKEDKTLKEKAAEQVLGKSLAPARWVTDGFKNGSIFLSNPVERLSSIFTNVTRSSCNKASTKLLPIKPAPPVTNIRIVVL
jgi:hypothetical protein